MVEQSVLLNPRISGWSSAENLDFYGLFFFIFYWFVIDKWHNISGTLDKGFEKEKLEKLENLYADKITYCKKCWARYTCAGECFAVGYENSGKFEKPTKVMCELKKYLIQLSVWFWTCLRFEHPEVYKSCVEKY